MISTSHAGNPGQFCCSAPVLSAAPTPNQVASRTLHPEHVLVDLPGLNKEAAKETYGGQGQLERKE